MHDAWRRRPTGDGDWRGPLRGRSTASSSGRPTRDPDEVQAAGLRSTRSRPAIRRACCRPTRRRSGRDRLTPGGRRRDRPHRDRESRVGARQPAGRPGVPASLGGSVGVGFARRAAPAGRAGPAIRTRPTGRSRARAAPAPGGPPPGTWMRLTRTRYQSDERPRMPSTRTSAGSRCRGDLGMARLPALEPLERLGLRRRPGDLDDRDRRLAPAGRRRPRAGPLGRQARVRVARRDRRRPLGGDLRRRPAGLAPTRLVLGSARALPSTAGPAAARRPASRSSAATARRPGPRPRAAGDSSSSASSDPTASSIPAPGSPIAGVPRRHGRERERLRLDGRDLVPGAAASRRAHRAAAGRSRPRRRCGPWRSGCSRGRRRGAPPSTTSSVAIAGRPALDVAGQRQRRPADLRVGPAAARCGR